MEMIIGEKNFTSQTPLPNQTQDPFRHKIIASGVSATLVFPISAADHMTYQDFQEFVFEANASVSTPQISVLSIVDLFPELKAGPLDIITGTNSVRSRLSRLQEIAAEQDFDPPSDASIEKSKYWIGLLTVLMFIACLLPGWYLAVRGSNMRRGTLSFFL